MGGRSGFSFAARSCEGTGDLFFQNTPHDEAIRKIYATDASEYQEKPLAVALPKSIDDVKLNIFKDIDNKNNEVFEKFDILIQNIIKSKLIISNNDKLNDDKLDSPNIYFNIDKLKEYKIIENQIAENSRDTNYYYFYKDHIVFKGKKYDQFSLLTRNIFEFSVISKEQDSLNQIKVQDWLFQDNKNEVKNLMTNYLKLIKEHNLATNLTPEKWFEITYKAPKFEEFLYIQPFIKEYEAENSYRYNDYETAVAVPSYENKYSKYFVQQDVLKSKYDTVSDAHSDEFIDIEMILSFLYGALAFSIILFSFRVTSGKSWLIAVVTAGIINMIYGIVTAVTNSSILYFYLLLFTILGILAYFLLIFFNKKSLQLSRIVLNLVLWSFAAIIPIVYFLTIEANRPENYYTSYSFDNYEESPFYTWLKEHIGEMFSLNFILSIFFLFILSKIIRNWKGIAEN